MKTTTVLRPACLALFTLLVMPVPSHAYLMVIRQGQEAPEVPNANDFLGWAVASGDFDGDGYDDLAMGAPGENEDIFPGREHGAVIVNYGGARGIRHTGAEFLTVGAIGETIVHYGLALAVGNFNNDAYDDLAVGLPDFDGSLGSVTSSGAVWIHLGGPGGLPTTPNLTLEATQAGEGLVALDRFGSALASGDFELDGFDDLAIGAPGKDSGSGAVYVFRGAASGIASGTGLSLRPVQLGSTPEFDGHFGAALAAGDLYGTTHEDLAIGAPDRMVSGLGGAGQVYLVAGSATGLTPVGSFIVDKSLLGAQVIANMEFGAALAIGRLRDVTGGGNQLAIGAPGHLGCEGATCGDDVGRVFVLRDFEPPFNIASYEQLDQNDAGSPVTLESELGDRFGHALAAGDFDDDGFDDLAVGTPGEDLENVPASGFSTTAAGQVFLWTGGAGDLGSNNAQLFQGRTLNDSLETGAQVGWALAFGRFDDSGRANLAIGAPTRDYRDYVTGANTNAAGIVYVLAPWRQMQNRPNRSSVALDCNGALVYAQRPFQSVTPASVTKALTVLIAVEAIQNNDIDSNYVYTVPDWVANNVSGSQAGLVTGQQIRFVDLIKLAISISAGDACYAIGDILTGENHTWNGLDNTIPGFSALMNLRASQLGMTQSTFNNPSGRPLAGHFSTAHDWAKFARQAMTNPLFRYFAGTRAWADIPFWPLTSNGWLSGMQDNWNPAIDGVKPGGNGLSMQTALVSALDMALGRYEASVFGVPSTSYGSPITDSASGASRDLLALSLAGCTPGLLPPPPGPDPDPWAWGHRTGIPTGPDPDPASCLLVPISPEQGGDALIEIYAEHLETASAAFTLETSVHSEVVLGPGESAVLTMSPADSHDGFRIYNVLRSAADLLISTSTPVASTPVFLASEATHVVPPQATLPGSHTLTILNASTSAGARLQVEEVGYSVAGTVGNRGPFTATVGADPHKDWVIIQACVDPGDALAGNLVYMVVRPPGATVGVDPPVIVATAPGVRLRAAAPNPFHSRTSLAYELDAAGPVWHRLYDATGRAVRTLARGTHREAGSHVVPWDGRDDDGRLVPSGVYFQHVASETGSASQRVVRLR